MPRTQDVSCDRLANLADLLRRGDVEVTFVNSEPPREGWLACWSPTDSLSEADTDLTLIRPSGDEPRPTPTRVKRVALTDAIEVLTTLDRGSRSTLLYAAAARFALGSRSVGAQ